MKKVVLLVAFIACATVASAQKMKVEKGDFTFLKGQTEINVVFDYSNLKLMEDNLTEEQYVENRVKDLNEKSKGNGEIWKKKWYGSRESNWEPKFLEVLNKVMNKSKSNISFLQERPQAQYTLIVEAVWIYPGWDVYMMKKPAKVTTRLRFVESSNHSNVLLEISSSEAPGDQWGNNFSNETRIGEGFAKTGKSLGGMIAKKLK